MDWECFSLYRPPIYLLQGSSSPLYSHWAGSIVQLFSVSSIAPHTHWTAYSTEHYGLCLTGLQRDGGIAEKQAKESCTALSRLLILSAVPLPLQPNKTLPIIFGRCPLEKLGGVYRGLQNEEKKGKISCVELSSTCTTLDKTYYLCKCRLQSVCLLRWLLLSPLPASPKTSLRHQSFPLEMSTVRDQSNLKKSINYSYAVFILTEPCS